MKMTSIKEHILEYTNTLHNTLQGDEASTPHTYRSTMRGKATVQTSQVCVSATQTSLGFPVGDLIFLKR